MSFRTALLAGACALLPAIASAQVAVEDPYARAASPAARSGAAFMLIANEGATDDRLVSAASDVAERVELHTHVMDGDVMRMIHVEEGFAVPAGETIALERGGMHVMFLGLTRPLAQGDTVEVTLSFERAGDVTVAIPVDNERMPGDMGHGAMQGDGHGAMHGHTAN
jgi:copper(I)-binding protein